jgi:hypothetical protein
MLTSAHVAVNSVVTLLSGCYADRNLIFIVFTICGLFNAPVSMMFELHLSSAWTTAAFIVIMFISGFDVKLMLQNIDPALKHTDLIISITYLMCPVGCGWRRRYPDTEGSWKFM